MNSLNIDKKVIEKIKGTRILITGATGMIAQNVINVLLELNKTQNADISIIAHIRNMQKAQKVFSEEIQKQIKLVEADVRELDLDEDIDYIIHTAGVTGGSKQHIDKPMTTISVALDGTRNVLDLAVKRNCKGLVYLSTLEIYGDTGFSTEDKVENKGGFVDPTNVRSSYSESKRMCENMCVAYTREYNLPTYIARLTATFGYGVTYTDNRVFAQFARSVIEKQNIVLKSTGETVRNYCDAQDAAVAFLYMLTNGTSGEAYNIANMDTEISIKDLAQKYITNYPESNISLIFDIADATQLGYNKVQRNVLNSQKLMDLGWKPMFSLDQSIDHLVNYMKNNK